MEVLVVLLMLWCAFGGLGWYIAGQKGRSGGEGAVLGFLFGPLGVLVEALLPSIEHRPKSSPGRSPGRARASAGWGSDYRDDWDAPKPPAEDPLEAQVLDFLNDSAGPPPPRRSLDEVAARAASEQHSRRGK